MKRVLKTIAARLPLRIQQELKRIFFAYQIRRNRFFTDEKEFAIVDRLISPGDWVLDIGANIGQYTKRFSELVGDSGRVIAFEPVPDTFELLTANAQRFRQKNVTLFNAAASDQCVALGDGDSDTEQWLVQLLRSAPNANSERLDRVDLPDRKLVISTFDSARQNRCRRT